MYKGKINVGGPQDSQEERTEKKKEKRKHDLESGQLSERVASYAFEVHECA